MTGLTFLDNIRSVRTSYDGGGGFNCMNKVLRNAARTDEAGCIMGYLVVPSHL